VRAVSGCRGLLGRQDAADDRRHYSARIGLGRLRSRTLDRAVAGWRDGVDTVRPLAQTPAGAAQASA
jgi:hypothetical protein